MVDLQACHNLSEGMLFDQEPRIATIYIGRKSTCDQWHIMYIMTILYCSSSKIEQFHAQGHAPG